MCIQHTHNLVSEALHYYEEEIQGFLHDASHVAQMGGGLDEALHTCVVFQK